MGSNTDHYGDKYWCIKTNLSKDGEIYIMGNMIEIGPSGELIVWGGESNTLVNLAIAPGNWTCVYAASVVDGAAVAVEYWDGEVNQNDRQPFPR